MLLKRYQAKQLRVALSDAYRDVSAMKLLLREEMNVRLENEVNVAQRYQIVVGDLVDWAEEQGRLAELIHVAALRNPNNPELKKFRESFGFVAVTSSALEQVSSLPAFDWLDPVEDVQLQGFFRKPLDLWDVNFLNKGLAQASSVCRIDAGSGLCGTGFLVRSDLVLTNCHVIFLSGSPDEPHDFSQVELRFRYLTEEGKESGESVRLASEPLVKWSPIDKLDYALLRIEPSASTTLKLSPVRYDAQHVQEQPVKQDGLHILQHPGGNTLKLALGLQGVTGIYPDRSRIQYVSQTYGGSSGSPCFNDDWELVAMHQSEISKIWGSVRQGILFRSIYEDIAEFLE
jgi:endonuclease G, mitochondrial